MSKALRQPSVRQIAIEQLLSSIENIEDVNSPDIFRYSQELHKLFVAGRNFDEQVLGCLRAARAVDQRIFISTSHSSHNLQLALSLAVDRFIVDNIHDTYAYWRQQIVFKTPESQRIIRQLGLRQIGVGVAYRMGYGFGYFSAIRRYVSDLGAKNRSDYSEAHHPKSAHEIIDALFDLRRYGLKTIVLQDDLTHSPESCWIFRDPRDYARAVVPTAGGHSRRVRLLGHKLIHLELVNKTQLQTINSLALSLVNSIKMTEVSIPIFKSEYDARLGFGMNRSGELTADLLDNQCVLRPIFERAGEHALAHYEMLRMMHTLHLFDLVVPTTIAERVTRVTREATLGGDGQPSEESLMRNLVLPRLRILEKRSELVSALEEEVERADDEMMRRSKRPLKRQEIAGHPRRLRAGHRASPHALALAQQYGVSLAENETFVETYFRGKGEQIINTVHFR